MFTKTHTHTHLLPQTQLHWGGEGMRGGGRKQSWRSRLSSSSPQAARPFWRPPALRVPPTWWEQGEGWVLQEALASGHLWKTSFSAAITLVGQTASYLVADSRELCCLVWIWWEYWTHAHGAVTAWKWSCQIHFIAKLAFLIRFISLCFIL